MYQPIRHAGDTAQCHARRDAPPARADFLRALLRLFAELACRLR